MRSGPLACVPDFARMALGTGLREREATVRTELGEAHLRQAGESAAILQVRRTANSPAQHQSMQGRSATGLQVGFVPHHRAISPLG